MWVESQVQFGGRVRKKLLASVLMLSPLGMAPPAHGAPASTAPSNNVWVFKTDKTSVLGYLLFFGMGTSLATVGAAITQLIRFSIARNNGRTLGVKFPTEAPQLTEFRWALSSEERAAYDKFLIQGGNEPFIASGLLVDPKGVKFPVNVTLSRRENLPGIDMHISRC